MTARVIHNFAGSDDRVGVALTLNIAAGIALLTSEVSPAEKEKAFSVKATCLVKIGGCRDAAKILPSVWH